MSESTREPDTSAEHLRASADALTDLARVLSSRTRSTGAPLFVDLVHYEHGFFLSPVLRGFPMLASAGGTVAVPPPPDVDDVPRDFAFEALSNWAGRLEIEALFSDRASALVNPRGATEQLPFTWATVVGRPVAEQVREVLEALASTVVRQGVSAQELAAAQRPLPEVLAAVEAQAARVATGIVDSVARSGWRVAAEELRVQAELNGRPLHVRYRATVFDPAALAERARLWRGVYNRLVPVREAIDRTTSGMARSMSIQGDGSSSDMLRVLNDQFENVGMRQFLAHVVRDSFVCGNGVMVFADVPSGDIRLVPPDDLLAVDGDEATVRVDGREERVRPVMHLPAGRQVGSKLGVSFLEPFVMSCANRDTFLSTLLTAELISQSRSAGDELRGWAAEMKPFAEARLREIDQRTTEVLGQATANFIDPAPGTYFEGQELMSPAAGRVTMIEVLDAVQPHGLS